MAPTDAEKRNTTEISFIGVKGSKTVFMDSGKARTVIDKFDIRITEMINPIIIFRGFPPIFSQAVTMSIFPIFSYNVIEIKYNKKDIRDTKMH